MCSSKSHFFREFRVSLTTWPSPYFLFTFTCEMKFTHLFFNFWNSRNFRKITCLQNNTYTSNQKRILHRLRRKYGNKKHHTLIYHAKLLNHELKATSTRLTYQKKTLDRKRINKHFANNPRNVYRSFRGNSTDIKEILAREEVGKYWNNMM